MGKAPPLRRGCEKGLVDAATGARPSGQPGEPAEFGVRCWQAEVSSIRPEQ